MPQPTRLILLTLLPLAACGPNYSPNTYASTAVQQAAKVDQGVVVGVRSVGVTPQGSTGAVAGGAAGAALGAAAPSGNPVSSTLGAIGGSLIGGLVGAGAEKAVGETTAFEYIVRKPSGELISVTQKDETALAVGTRVLVIAGSQARIVPDYTVPPDAPAEARPAPSALPLIGTTSEPEPARPAPAANE
jgi:outer membrane lipoprotein SlyB